MVETLRKKLSKGEVPVAWLFSGQPGTGKTTLGRIVANMVQGDDILADLAEYDIQEINAADFSGIESVREMIRAASYRPIRGQYKVYILDEAHQLSDAAQNCLLVPCEDKNSSTVWIFCTTRPDKMIDALKRRCFSFHMKGLTETESETLVNRALDGDNRDLVSAIVGAEITSPGVILQVVEKYKQGLPPAECVTGLAVGHEPLYKDVAKAVLSGNWTRVAGMLEQIRTADARGLRQVLASLMSYALLQEGIGPRADAISGCLLGLATYNSYEDGIAYAATRAALYRCCKQMGVK